MKLRRRILWIVALAVLTLVGACAFSLCSLRQTMLSERKQDILRINHLAMGVMARYHALEANGKLTRSEAQARAVEALLGVKFNDDYVFVRTLDNFNLVHADARRLGKIDKGSPMPDGRLPFARRLRCHA